MRISTRAVAWLCIASMIGLSVSCSSDNPVIPADIEVPPDQAAALIGLILVDTGEFVIGLAQILAAYVQAGPAVGGSQRMPLRRSARFRHRDTLYGGRYGYRL